MGKSLRILLADDNPAVIKIVTCLLERDFIVAGAVSNGTSVLSQAPQLKPDIIILDVSMGDPNGFEVCRELKASQCPAKIIFLTIHQELEFVRAAFDAGASGYVYKGRLGTDLRAAMGAVQLGNTFIPEVASSR